MVIMDSSTSIGSLHKQKVQEIRPYGFIILFRMSNCVMKIFMQMISEHSLEMYNPHSR